MVKNTVQHGRLSPLVVPAADPADNDHTVEDLCRGRQASARVERSGNGVVRATGAINCAALVSARDLLKKLAVDLRVLAFYTIESCWTLQGDPIADS